MTDLLRELINKPGTLSFGKAGPPNCDPLGVHEFRKTCSGVESRACRGPTFALPVFGKELRRQGRAAKHGGGADGGIYGRWRFTRYRRYTAYWSVSIRSRKKSGIWNERSRQVGTVCLRNKVSIGVHLRLRERQ